MIELVKPQGKVELVKPTTGGADTEYINNYFANALKAHKSGELVAINDLSPIPHDIKAVVKRKNIFNKENLQHGTESWKSTPNLLEDGRIYVPQNAMNSSKTLKQLAPSIEVGKTYMLTFTTTGTNNWIYLGTTKETWTSGKTRTIVETDLDSQVYFYTFSGDDKNKPAYVTNMQIELGTTATPYTPYIEDLEAVKVVAQGKNLVKESTFYDAANWNINIYHEGAYYHGFYKLNLKENTQYTFSWDCEDDFTSQFQISKYTKGTEPRYGEDKAVAYISVDGNVKKTVTFTTESGMNYGLFVSATYQKVYDIQYFLDNAVKWIQIEQGKTASPYEPYTAAVYEQGQAIAPIYPTTTIGTDTDGAIVETEYNKDINKAFAEMQAAFISLGANV